jgi:putative membrane protein
VYALSLVAAAVAAALHVFIFAMESLWFTRPGIYRRFGVRSPEDAAILQPMAFNQGFYNLFLAIGAGAGVVARVTGHDAVGRTLVLFSCGCMLLAAVVLASSNPRMLRGALIQGVAPLVAVVATVL